MSTVSVTIDYSNGVQKQFSRIPWRKDLTVLAAIEAGAASHPGAVVAFGSDRSGHVLGLKIDDMPGKATPALDWSVWINAKPFANRLGTETSFGFRPEERAFNLLQADDQVLLKLCENPSEPSLP